MPSFDNTDRPRTPEKAVIRNRKIDFSRQEFERQQKSSEASQGESSTDLRSIPDTQATDANSRSSEQKQSRIHHITEQTNNAIEQISNVIDTGNKVIQYMQQNPLITTSWGTLWGKAIASSYDKLTNADTPSYIDTTINILHNIQYMSAAVSEINDLYTFLVNIRKMRDSNNITVQTDQAPEHVDDHTNSLARKQEQSYLHSLKELSVNITRGGQKVIQFISERPLLLHLIATEWSRTVKNARDITPSLQNDIAIQVTDYIEFAAHTVATVSFCNDMIKYMKRVHSSHQMADDHVNQTSPEDP